MFHHRPLDGSIFIFESPFTLGRPISLISGHYSSLFIFRCYWKNHLFKINIKTISKWFSLLTRCRVFIFFIFYFSNFIVIRRKCPSRDNISPCTCNFLEEITGTSVLLSCFDREVNDTKIGEILTSYIATPNVTPLSVLDLSYNSLTQIPKEVVLFSALVDVNLNHNNIRSIPFDAIHCSSKCRSISLVGNQLTNIEPGAFQGIIYCILKSLLKLIKLKLVFKHRKFCQ